MAGVTAQCHVVYAHHQRINRIVAEMLGMAELGIQELPGSHGPVPGSQDGLVSRNALEQAQGVLQEAPVEEDFEIVENHGRLGLVHDLSEEAR